MHKEAADILHASTRRQATPQRYHSLQPLGAAAVAKTQMFVEHQTQCKNFEKADAQDCRGKQPQPTFQEPGAPPSGQTEQQSNLQLKPAPAASARAVDDLPGTANKPVDLEPGAPSAVVEQPEHTRMPTANVPALDEELRKDTRPARAEPTEADLKPQEGLETAKPFEEPEECQKDAPITVAVPLAAEDLEQEMKPATEPLAVLEEHNKHTGNTPPGPLAAAEEVEDAGHVTAEPLAVFEEPNKHTGNTPPGPQEPLAMIEEPNKHAGSTPPGPLAAAEELEGAGHATAVPLAVLEEPNKHTGNTPPGPLAAAEEVEDAGHATAKPLAVIEEPDKHRGNTSPGPLAAAKKLEDAGHATAEPFQSTAEPFEANKGTENATAQALAAAEPDLAGMEAEQLPVLDEQPEDTPNMQASRNEKAPTIRESKRRQNPQKPAAKKSAKLSEEAEAINTGKPSCWAEVAPGTKEEQVAAKEKKKQQTEAKASAKRQAKEDSKAKNGKKAPKAKAEPKRSKPQAQEPPAKKSKMADGDDAPAARRGRKKKGADEKEGELPSKRAKKMAQQSVASDEVGSKKRGKPEKQAPAGKNDELPESARKKFNGKTAEAKAKLSRKSAAYHAKFKTLVGRGVEEEEARRQARQVGNTCTCMHAVSICCCVVTALWQAYSAQD